MSDKIAELLIWLDNLFNLLRSSQKNYQFSVLTLTMIPDKNLKFPPHKNRNLPNSTLTLLYILESIHFLNSYLKLIKREIKMLVRAKDKQTNVFDLISISLILVSVDNYN